MTRKDILFVLACMFFYAFVVLSVPPYTPLLEPDSGSYLTFDATRTALYPAFLRICAVMGLDLVQITWLQLVIFTIALGYLLVVLQRAGFPKALIGLFVVALAANVLFSSFHRSIMTESINFSIGAIAIACWIDYFRTGRAMFLGFAGLALGLMIGIRPAAIGLIPAHALAAWMKMSKRSVSILTLSAALVVPLLLGIISERLIYRAVHGDKSATLTPYLFMAKAAMLVRANNVYTGSHAAALNTLGGQLFAIYEPVQQYLADAPSLAVRTYLSAYYESQAHFSVLVKEAQDLANREGMSVDELRTELGRQAILQNIPGYFKLTLLNDLGQWSVGLAHFPPTARALTRYAETNPAIDFDGRIAPELLHPKPSVVGLVAYPVFLAAGAITLLLSLGLIVFLVRPSLMDRPNGLYLVLAVFFSSMCQSYTLFISLANVWTPRFLMSVFPQLGIVAICLILVLLRQRKIGLLRRRG